MESQSLKLRNIWSFTISQSRHSLFTHVKSLLSHHSSHHCRILLTLEFFTNSVEFKQSLVSKNLYIFQSTRWKLLQAMHSSPRPRSKMMTPIRCPLRLIREIIVASVFGIGPVATAFKDLARSRDECKCNPVRYFAIISTQRSGSGWFETLLNSHINISSNGEIFSVKVRRSNISTIVETLDKIYNLDWLTSASKNECTAAVGLKWMLNQGLMQHHEEIVEYFNTKGVSLIFLFRRNLLRRMISILSNSYDQNAKPLNGTHKSHVHSSHEAEILASYKPTIDTTLLIPNLRQVEEMTAKALEYFKSTQHIILYYEDIIKNSTKLKDVQDFLRVPQRDLKSQQVKIHKGSLSQHVENWDDIQRALYGTPYESFLHSDYNM
ncbi:hypothetical protein HYC85_017391 [Camellia sinensis]|uniref:Sulfotransferase n=1 Tax=Camellia sinensis TaxID=4442 RepID=A0A7J7GV51_CAMSI|nr:hypothetical protein HYC85_017391 [Camellia sinensis]